MRLRVDSLRLRRDAPNSHSIPVRGAGTIAQPLDQLTLDLIIGRRGIGTPKVLAHDRFRGLK